MYCPGLHLMGGCDKLKSAEKIHTDVVSIGVLELQGDWRYLFSIGVGRGHDRGI